MHLGTTTKDFIYKTEVHRLATTVKKGSAILGLIKQDIFKGDKDTIVQGIVRHHLQY